eukprot:CAMPEP_0119301296 /NCGR_PEP_ID=MMETSP1333-20130426/3091_1 /TAXON_ID=418940 /ORGANISM="Scyphosphaera apsteinii, Strain RCC1455" /LENGTH=246 /DNA_ID=CAMNT_0007303327 /DNA_START=26 /DNA_END=763 /DNA_ORIENTATION=+
MPSQRTFSSDYVLASKLLQVKEYLSSVGKWEHNQINASFAAMQNRFEDVYKYGIWQHGDPSVPKSGTGSTLHRTKSVRASILEVMGMINATLIVDAPCGDVTWMRALFPEFAKRRIRYIGLDIVRSEIGRLQAEFRGNPMVSFAVANIVTDRTPRADLIFSRQSLQHLQAEHNLRVLYQWSRSGSRYLMQTQYTLSDIVPDENYNRLSYGAHSRIDFMKAPYNLTPPLSLYGDSEGIDYHEDLALW